MYYCHTEQTKTQTKKQNTRWRKSDERQQAPLQPDASKPLEPDGWRSIVLQAAHFFLCLLQILANIRFPTVVAGVLREHLPETHASMRFPTVAASILRARLPTNI
jgi:hypothetical protein